MAVDDHGLEVLKKSGEEITPGDKSDYYVKTSDIGKDDNGRLLVKGVSDIFENALVAIRYNQVEIPFNIALNSDLVTESSPGSSSPQLLAAEVGSPRYHRSC